MECPCCKGRGWFASHAEGSLSDDCDICDGKGVVPDGMRMIPRFIRMPKYVIDCRQCGTENHFRNSSCYKCAYQFT